MVNSQPLSLYEVNIVITEPFETWDYRTINLTQTLFLQWQHQVNMLHSNTLSCLIPRSHQSFMRQCRLSQPLLRTNWILPCATCLQLSPRITLISLSLIFTIISSMSSVSFFTACPNSLGNINVLITESQRPQVFQFISLLNWLTSDKDFCH